MGLSRILFQRGLFFVEPIFYGTNEHIPYDIDEYNHIIDCSSTDILTIRKHISEMSKKCCIMLNDYDLYTIDE